ncbi:hypothetical protein [Trichococcus shcherbakoviae]|uniref:lipopolysaccharide biosynthesis protein n=1 Tax=Trichococcus shcherbakoviae TaxID=2094020 RepID=UPI0029F51BCF|nr:hypothetical protein [Trichococcus shcherbakoviae]
MNSNSRTYNSIKNTIFGFMTQGLTIVLSFVTRTVFIKYLSIEYLGVNGLFTNVLTILSLSELGFGTAMMYSMYKPLAEKNEHALEVLMNFYAKVYRIIGLVVGVVGLTIMPFLDYIIKDTPGISNLKLIYLLFLFNSVASYFFSHKKSIIQADQKQYIIAKIHLVSSIIKTLVQIIILIITGNYIIFLLVQISVTLFENILISLEANKLYPFLKSKNNYQLERKEKSSIWTNVKALMIYRVGSVALDGSDNIIISTFVGVAAVGTLSNYTLIIGTITTLLMLLSDSVLASVGNYVVSENEKKQEELLEYITFLHFVMYGFSFISIVFLVNPFIEIWLNSSFILNFSTTIVIAVNFYILGMMNPIWMFRRTKGLFVYGKYRPIISALINIVVSIVLAQRYGLIGVLLGTTVTRGLTNVWFDPYIIYRYGFNTSVKKYYLKTSLYAGVLFLLLMLMMLIFSFLPSTGIGIFLVKLLLCVSITPLIIIIVFKNTKEYIYFKSIFLRMMNITK